MVHPAGNRPTVGHLARPSAGALQVRRGFTILELLTTIGIIGILAALLLPAINSARESARRLQCTSHLHQVGLALHSYHDQHNSLPSGWQCESSGQTGYGWAVSLLPYMEQRLVYDRVNSDRSLMHSVNSEARSTSVAMFLCPSDIAEAGFTLFHEDEKTGTSTAVGDLPTASYLGVFGTVEPDEANDAAVLGNGTFSAGRWTRLADLHRGSSNTIVVGERTMERLPSTWLGVDFRGEDAVLRMVGVALTSPNGRTGEDGEPEECEFTSRHAFGANFLWGDGHVQFVSETIDPGEYRRLAMRAGF